MIRDLEFLYYSNVGNFFNFANKNDPFLTNLTHEESQQQQAGIPGKIIQYISKPLLNRIKICEGILMEEILNEKINKGKYLPGQQLDNRFPK